MILINTEASARCAHRCDDPEPFQRLPHREQTVKTIRLVQRLYHRAKASVLMKLCWRRLRSRRFLSFPGAPGGRALPMLLFALLIFASCRRDMMDQPKAKTFSKSSFFKDGTNARPIPPNTVARGDVRLDQAFYTGIVNGVYVTQSPVELRPQLLRHGRQRYDAFCAVCHGRVGDGHGMVVQRGFPQPPSFHVERLRNAPLGHFFDVITNGYGAMASFATKVEPRERWAIAAYIRTLQLSQNANTSDLPADERKKLEQTQ